VEDETEVDGSLGAVAAGNRASGTVASCGGAGISTLADGTGLRSGAAAAAAGAATAAVASETFVACVEESTPSDAGNFGLEKFDAMLTTMAPAIPPPTMRPRARTTSFIEATHFS
jgi:hypothetical protein